MCAHEYRYLQRPEASDPQEVELQVVVSYPKWVLGTEGRASAQILTAEPFLQLSVSSL